LIVIIGSIGVLILIQLLKNNLNTPANFLEWRQLTWDDFQGPAKLFTKWDAGINSNVYVKFDSTTLKFQAYAAMNNRLSWRKYWSQNGAADYLLKHEQYHFNITEYFARKLNKTIEKDILNTKEEVLYELSLTRIQLSKMQQVYDTESNHSLSRNLQLKWEFQIDSMLNFFDPESGFVTDFYSGAKVRMPSKHKFFEGIRANQLAYREYQLDKYNMIFTMVSHQYINLPIDDFVANLKGYYEEKSQKQVEYEVSKDLYDYEVRVEGYDSLLNETTLYRWIHHEDYIYKISATFPESNTLTTYKSIANSYLNSFKIINTSKYWVDKFYSEDRQVISGKTAPINLNEQNQIENLKCVSFENPMQYGFHGKPIFKSDGSLILPFKIIEHPDSLIQEVLISYKDQWFFHQNKPKDQLLIIPSKHLDLDFISFDLGYLLKEDSVNSCYKFYYQHFETDRNDIQQ
tara:strand:- start:40530 stop:41906 length:1377 start_codon:yes stop_codon:yes gene_type:complete